MVRSDGTIYFTDPPFGTTDEERELPFEGVFSDVVANCIVRWAPPDKVETFRERSGCDDCRFRLCGAMLSWRPIPRQQALRCDHSRLPRHPPTVGHPMATSVTAPMVGKILQLRANVGDHVQEDETIIVMEAMKMEIEVVAPASGTVADIRVAPGDSVNPETILAIIE